MRRARDSDRDPTDEYHSFVVRVRAHPTGSAATAKPALSIRVEYVNKRKAMHFNDLTGALDFIANSVRRNVLHPEP